MQDDTSDARQLVTNVAYRHGVSLDAVRTVLRALGAGHGTMAQFDHPDLGGLGQWNLGGMTMVGRMFDRDLKTRVDALCTELAALLRDHPDLGLAPTGGGRGPEAGTGFSGETWWPPEFGQPSTAGSQNDMRYAVFPAARRLAIETGGRVTLYDTGDHLLSGVSQQQGLDQRLAFTSQHGSVPLPDLPVVEPGAPSPPRAGDPAPDREGAADAAVRQPAPGPSPEGHTPANHAPVDHMATLAGLADLHARGVLTDSEFAAKKAEILARI
ncbi:MAG: SHOCT domain-containing protein [Microvirga sp.]